MDFQVVFKLKNADTVTLSITETEKFVMNCKHCGKEFVISENEKAEKIALAFNTHNSTCIFRGRPAGLK